MESRLLKRMFSADSMQEVIDTASEKELDTEIIRKLCYPEVQKAFVTKILKGEYTISPPHVALIPKDVKGEFRTVYINEDLDRIFLSLANQALCVEFKDMIHPHCVSYQRGMSTQKTIKIVSKELSKLSKIINRPIGYKSDFSKYFDTVAIDAIDNVFDEMERRLGFEHGDEPVINVLRKYYHQDLYFDENGKLQNKYQALKQGCAVASILSNAILYELDEFMSNKYKVYYRYSDDVICLDDDYSTIIDDINNICAKYGVKLNPKKVEPLYSDKWFKFLGFELKRDLITLHPARLKKFQAEIEARSIDIKRKRKSFNGANARKLILRYLYEGEYCWATSCLGTVNVKRDLETMNAFIMDCIRACDTNKLRVGGLGSNLQQKDYTVQRGKGRHVKNNKNNTGKNIENYLTMTCLSNAMKISNAVYEATIKSIK